MAKGPKNLYLSTNPTVQPPIQLHVPVRYPGETPDMVKAGVNFPVQVGPLDAYPNTITIKRRPK